MTIKGINPTNLEDWFERNVDGAKPPLDFALITGGHSNLTFKVDDSAGHEYVLRRPPTGAWRSRSGMRASSRIASSRCTTDW